jgi:hypothetical protein
LRRDALFGLAAAYRAQRRWYGVASALALLAADAPWRLRTPDTLALRFEVATARRDLREALAISREPTAPDRIRALEPVLAQLAAMQPTAHRRVHGIGALGSSLMLHVRTPVPHTVFVAADPALEVQREDPRARMFAAGSGAHPRVVHDDGPELTLLAAEPAGLRELQRFPAPAERVSQAIAVDLDGDDIDEVYITDQAGLHALTPAGPDGWRRVDPHPGTNAARSNGDALAAGDLDGDGDPELVAAIGPWSAYDLRVFRTAGVGMLTQVARRKLGHTGGVQVIRSPGGPRIVALVTESYPSSAVFPADHPRGAPAGLYFLRLEAGGLVVEHSLAVPDSSEADLVPRCFFTGDLDGDGLEDVVARLDQPATGVVPTGTVAWVLRQTADGSFASTTIGGIQPLAVLELDDDPGHELLFSADEDETLWIAGFGGSTIPARDAPGVDLADAHGRDLAAAGAPLDVVALARAGAPELALAVTTQLAAVAADDERRRLQLAAARVAADLQRPAEVIDLLADVADDPALRAEALERRTRALLALGRQGEAAQVAAEWIAEPGLDPQARARAAAIHGPLAQLVAAHHLLSLRLTGGDAPARIDPVALRREENGALVLDSFVGAEAALGWTLDWSGGRLAVEIGISPRALDWSAGLEVRILTGDQVLARSAVRVHGGDIHHELLLVCGPGETGLGLPVAADGSAERLRLRLLLDPARGEVECAVQGPRELHRLFDRLGGPVRGPVRLEIGPAPDFGGPGARMQVVLERVELMGARPVASDADEVAAALVEADGAQALRGPWRLDDPTAAIRRGLALMQLGRWRDAARELRSAATGDALVIPGRLLRARPDQMAPVLREALGDRRYFALYAEAFAPVLDRRRFGPADVRSLVHDLAGVEDACADADVCRRLLRARARAQAQRGDRPRSRSDLVRVLGRSPPPAEAALVHVDLAVLSALEGDPAGVLSQVESALDVAPAVEVVRDMVRARPELGPDAAPGLAELLGPDDRTLTLVEP